MTTFETLILIALFLICESVTKASTSTGISRTSISNNLSGKSKSAGGFVWKKV